MKYLKGTLIWPFSLDSRFRATIYQAIRQDRSQRKVSKISKIPLRSCLTSWKPIKVPKTSPPYFFLVVQHYQSPRQKFVIDFGVSKRCVIFSLDPRHANYIHATLNVTDLPQFVKGLRRRPVAQKPGPGAADSEQPTQINPDTFVTTL